LESSADTDTADEVHWLSFPDEHSFASYREDAELVALADTRAEVIERTTVLRGREAEAFVLSA
jgi:hypothetical protein